MTTITLPHHPTHRPRGRRYTYAPTGERLTLAQIAEIEGVTVQAVRKRRTADGSVEPSRGRGKRRGVPVYDIDGTRYAESVTEAVRRSGATDRALRLSYLELYRDGWRLTRRPAPRRNRHAA